MTEGTITETSLVGDIKVNQTVTQEYTKIILIELEQFMIKYKIDKIDIGWSKDFLNLPIERRTNIDRR